MINFATPYKDNHVCNDIDPNNINDARMRNRIRSVRHLSPYQKYNLDEIYNKEQ